MRVGQRVGEYNKEMTDLLMELWDQYLTLTGKIEIKLPAKEAFFRVVYNQILKEREKKKKLKRFWVSWGCKESMDELVLPFQYWFFNTSPTFDNLYMVQTYRAVIDANSIEEIERFIRARCLCFEPGFCLEKSIDYKPLDVNIMPVKFENRTKLCL